jgi:predicted transcriptional regulator
MSNSDTLTIRLDRSVKERLEGLAAITKRTKSSLAAEAIESFVELEERQLEGIRKALASLDRGEGVAHEDVVSWLKSWGTEPTFPIPGGLTKPE